MQRWTKTKNKLNYQKKKRLKSDKETNNKTVADKRQQIMLFFFFLLIVDIFDSIVVNIDRYHALDNLVLISIDSEYL